MTGTLCINLVRTPALFINSPPPHSKHVYQVNILHVNLTIPVTAKFRVFPTVEKTVEYAKMIESAGAQILTCHGRLREQRGHNSVGRIHQSALTLG